MAIQQKVSICLTSTSRDDTFKIINIFQSQNNELVVVAEFQSPHGNIPLDVRPEDEVTLTDEQCVQVPEELPVKFYVIGINHEFERYAPKFRHTSILNRTRIPVSDTAHTLFPAQYIVERSASPRIELTSTRINTEEVLEEIAAKTRKPSQKILLSNRSSPCCTNTPPAKVQTLQDKLPSLSTLGLFAFGITALGIAGYVAYQSLSTSARKSL